MRHVSTRGLAEPLPFEDVLLEGLATDGGLYLPDRWPSIDASQVAQLGSLDYPETAFRVLRPLVDGAFADDELREMCRQAYGAFSHEAIAPLKQIGANEWLLELFHGPTLAFKDFALQLLGPMFEQVLARREQRITIVGATSGDTGSAAIHACAGRANLDIFIMFPKGRISEVQRRQMTTVAQPNVHVMAIDGSFDDCQSFVKALFGDLEFRRRMSLAAINSINWARIAAQIVYYFFSAVRLGGLARPVRFVVPTGNFGDVYAGYAAARMGLPIDELIVATNRNDILARFFESGQYARGDISATMSPSMDIQVASNFERLLFDIFKRDGRRIAQMMEDFRRTKSLSVDAALLAPLRPRFRAGRASEEQTLAMMDELMSSTGEMIDPHTAVGLSVGRQLKARDTAQTIYLATAHPAKFPDASSQAFDRSPPTPERLAHIFELEERCTTLPNDLSTVKSFISDRVQMP